MEILNSDARIYGGADLGNMGRVESQPVPMHGRPNSVSLTVPPLAGIFLKSP
jgi:1,4-alpha-glucan branching enzyme